MVPEGILQAGFKGCAKCMVKFFMLRKGEAKAKAKATPKLWAATSGKQLACSDIKQRRVLLLGRHGVPHARLHNQLVGGEAGAFTSSSGIGFRP